MCCEACEPPNLFSEVANMLQIKKACSTWNLLSTCSKYCSLKCLKSLLLPAFAPGQIVVVWKYWTVFTPLLFLLTSFVVITDYVKTVQYFTVPYRHVLPSSVTSFLPQSEHVCMRGRSSTPPPDPPPRLQSTHQTSLIRSIRPCLPFRSSCSSRSKLLGGGLFACSVTITRACQQAGFALIMVPEQANKLLAGGQAGFAGNRTKADLRGDLSWKKIAVKRGSWK